MVVSRAKRHRGAPCIGMQLHGSSGRLKQQWIMLRCVDGQTCWMTIRDFSSRVCVCVCPDHDTRIGSLWPSQETGFAHVLVAHMFKDGPGKHQSASVWSGWSIVSTYRRSSSLSDSGDTPATVIPVPSCRMANGSYMTNRGPVRSFCISNATHRARTILAKTAGHLL